MDQGNKITRRDFCLRMLSSGLAAGALLRGAAVDASQSSPPQAPTNLRLAGGKSLLSQSDFTYQGY